jgi:hypothetical protein
MAVGDQRHNLMLAIQQVESPLRRRSAACLFLRACRRLQKAFPIHNQGFFVQTVT